MVVITVEAYQNVRVHTITVKNKDFLCKNERCTRQIRHINDLLRKEICGRFGVKDF